MADRVAGGDLTVRMPETGPGEVGILERAFNSMAGSLETSTHELRRIAEEQAALRQGATLGARAGSPIGRAAGRGRGEISGGAVSFKKKKTKSKKTLE